MNKKKIWENPSIESYYLLNRWKSQNKTCFLDLGCGLSRHSFLYEIGISLNVKIC